MSESFSLLWLDSAEIQTTPILSATAFKDLHIGDILAQFSTSGHSRKFFTTLLHHLPTDPKTIAYRQAILSDLIDHPNLSNELAALLPKLDGLTPQLLTIRKRPALYSSAISLISMVTQPCFACSNELAAILAISKA